MLLFQEKKKYPVHTHIDMLIYNAFSKEGKKYIFWLFIGSYKIIPLMFLKYQILICISFLNIYLEAVNGAQPLINKTFLRLYMCGRLLFTLCCYHSGPFTDINKLWIDLILLLNCQSFHPVPGNMLIKLTGKFWGFFLSFLFLPTFGAKTGTSLQVSKYF